MFISCPIFKSNISLDSGKYALFNDMQHLKICLRYKCEIGTYVIQMVVYLLTVFERMDGFLPVVYRWKEKILSFPMMYNISESNET